MELDAPGCSLDSTPHAQHYPDAAPSILGMPYAAAHGADRLVIGSTKRSGLSAEAALACVVAGERDSAGTAAEGCQTASREAAAAAEELQGGIAAVWEPAAGWQVNRVRSVPACFRM